MKNKAALTVLGIVLGLYLVLNIFTGVITDFLWFKSLNFEKIFLINLGTYIAVLIPTVILVFLLLHWYTRLLLRKYSTLGKVILSQKENKYIRKILLFASLLVTLYISLTFTSSSWYKFLQFFNKVSFSTADPIFSNDISFYFYVLPLINTLLNTLISIAVILILITIGFYIVMVKLYPPAPGVLFDINELNHRPNIKSIFRKDLSVYAIKKITYFSVVFFFILGVSLWLRTYSLLYSSLGVIYGAGYTDVHIYILGYKTLSIISFVGAIALPFLINKNRFKFAVVIPALLIALSLIMTIVGFAVQQLYVEPDEISKEKQYITNNIEFTRKAYNVMEVSELDFPVEQNLTSSDLKDNEQIVSNIRINDARPLTQTFNQIQVIRLYYMFNDVDIDRYTFGDDYRQVLISARELNTDKLVDTARTWLNLHIKYTHGYGLVLAPVNEVTPEGQPDLFIKNVPPVTNQYDIKIERPEIYFGELTKDYIIINTKENEFDYPYGSDNKENRYEGADGIKLNFLNKLLFAIRENSLKMLLSTNLNPDSRIIVNRNINERVTKLLPFVKFDSNPYLVINQEDGTLSWIIDGYTMSDMYPYSQTYNFEGKNINYVRNSIKAVVDAYNGSVDFYIYDENDPMIKTFDNMYPGLLKSKQQMPKSLSEHVRYPQSLFNMQSEVLKAYHVTNPTVFYNGEDFWDIANEKFMSEVQKIESNYVMYKLPESEKVEFVLMLPFTPKEKPNMTSMLVARNDGENYGQLVVYRLPKDKTIDGPMMIESRIDQDSTISPQFTLWSQEGSRVLRGNVITTPIGNSLLYVEPIYIQADNENSIPELKRVVVVYKDKIVMEETLEKSLAKIFTGGVVEPETPEKPPVDQDTLKGDILEAYEELKAKMEELRKLLEQLINEETITP